MCVDVFISSVDISSCSHTLYVVVCVCVYLSVCMCVSVCVCVCVSVYTVCILVYSREYSAHTCIHIQQQYRQFDCVPVDNAIKER